MLMRLVYSRVRRWSELIHKYPDSVFGGRKGRESLKEAIPKPRKMVIKGYWRVGAIRFSLSWLLCPPISTWLMELFAERQVRGCWSGATLVVPLRVHEVFFINIMLTCLGLLVSYDEVAWFSLMLYVLTDGVT